MTMQLMLRSAFPIDVLILLAVALVAGFGWGVGTWLCGKALR